MFIPGPLVSGRCKLIFILGPAELCLKQAIFPTINCECCPAEGRLIANTLWITTHCSQYTWDDHARSAAAGRM